MDLENWVVDKEYVKCKVHKQNIIHVTQFWKNQDYKNLKR